jgi:GNAT superfamily N-acetyltransferase
MDSPWIKIVEARNENLPVINALIARSKAYWKWPDGHLERALPLLMIRPEVLLSCHGFEAWREQSLVAFACLKAVGSSASLNDLWVEPSEIRTGIGSMLWAHIVQLARERGWTEISVLPDPPSKGFYLKCGFKDTGKSVPSRIPGGPEFSVLTARVSEALG